MELFELINAFFDIKKYSKITRYDKEKNAFMVNRFCSINYPMQAALLSKNNINQSAIVDYWQSILITKYKSTPTWMFIKTKKTSDSNKKSNIPMFDISIKKEYCRLNQCSLKDLEQCIKYFPKEISEELTILEKYLDIKKKK